MNIIVLYRNYLGLKTFQTFYSRTEAANFIKTCVDSSELIGIFETTEPIIM